MLGAIIGDTVGSAYEFHNTKDYDFTLFLGNSEYTDDSVMTMAVAYWLSVLDRDSDIGMQELLEEDLEKWLDPDRGIAYIEEPENLRPMKKVGRQEYENLSLLDKFL